MTDTKVDIRAAITETCGLFEVEVYSYWAGYRVTKSQATFKTHEEAAAWAELWDEKV